MSQIQEQETLAFIRENLEKSEQLTKGMVSERPCCVCFSSCQHEEAELTKLIGMRVAPPPGADWFEVLCGSLCLWFLSSGVDPVVV